MHPKLSSREKLLKSATEMFSRSGFRATSVRDISVRAGVSEMTVFRLFGTKEAIIREVIDAVMRDAHLAEHATIALSVGDDIEAMRRAASVFWDAAISKPEIIRLAIFAATEEPEINQHRMREYILPFYMTLAKGFQRGVRRGVFKRVHAMSAVRFLVGGHFALAITDGIMGDEGIPEMATRLPVETFFDIWLEGVRNK